MPAVVEIEQEIAAQRPLRKAHETTSPVYDLTSVNFADFSSAEN
jgi:hypothetical protein